MTRARETSENARQAKAWVNFDGTFGSSPYTLANGGIRSAFNVSSVLDHGTGNYGVVFEDNMSSTDYVGVVTISADNTGGTYAAIPVVHQLYAGTSNSTNSGFPAVNQFRFQCSIATSWATLKDQTSVYVVFYE